MDHRDQGTRFPVVVTRAIAPQTASVVEIGAESVPVFARQIDPAAILVFFHIAQDIRQLKRDTAFFRELQSLRILEPKDVNDGQANH